MMTELSPRNLALSVLNRLDRNWKTSDELVDQMFFENPHLTFRDRAFVLNLIQGTLRFRLRLDWVIRQSTRFSFQKIEPGILNILRIALYQIFYMDRVPQSAAVNEAVKQAKGGSTNHIPRFVNGILRQICRTKNTIKFPDPEKDKSNYLSVYYSYPEWLVKKWVRELGSVSAEKLLHAQNRIPARVIRTNPLKVSRTDLVSILKNEGVDASPTQFSPDGLVLDNLKGPVNRLQAFKKGLFQVQGEAAQICSYLLGPKPGEFVLDLCAGLGGKSTHLAGIMKAQGSVLSLDIQYGRLVSLLENSRRLGIPGIQAMVSDATSSALKIEFDRVIVDAPCSGLGVLSKHPDGKWSRDGSDIVRLTHLQKKILNQTVPLLKKSGVLLYVTCTISTEENEDMVRSLLEKHEEIVLEDLNHHVPEWCRPLIDEQGYFRPLPHVHGLEGFFAALFIKK